MCGIVGVVARNKRLDMAILAEAVDAMAARGPDDRGLCQLLCPSSDASAIFGHRRLSILDVSSAGHQPMVSPDGRVTVVYNGEIYNFLELRTELEAHGFSFRSHCDTEVILAAYQYWGEDFVSRCNGIFAIALWDADRGRVVFYRDRIGLKPLYLGFQGERFYFSSVLSSLVRIPGFSRQVDSSALLAYVWAGFVPGPYAMFQGIRKLLPGHMAVLDVKTWQLTSRPYWRMVDAAAVAEKDLPDRPMNEWVDDLEALLSDAVRLQMISDVPLGAFLSGGIDSSLVVSLMRKANTGAVRTFSIGFDVEKFNEAPQAKAIAAHLGTDHHELILSSADVRNVIPDVPEIYDEPFSDSSCLPMILLSRMTRKSVAVALSGDGGDDLFLGDYRHYALADRWRYTSWIPWPIRRLLGAGLCAIPHYYLRRIGQSLRARGFGQFYQSMVSIWQDSEFRGLFLQGDPREAIAGIPIVAAADELAKYHRPPRLMASVLDFYGVVPDDFAVKVDRASMASSLEVRTPVLDHRVAEFARRIPIGVLLGDGTPKYLLRTILERHVPRSLWDRPKMGFAVPLCVWFRGDLYDYMRQVLLDSGGLPFDIFCRDTIEEVIQAHKSGQKDRYRLLWSLMSLSMWYRRYCS